MFYSNELQFLINVFKKSHIAVTFASYGDLAENFIDMSFERLAGFSLPEKLSIAEYLGNIEEKTMYKLSDHFGVSYIYFLLPQEKKTPIMIIGPYTTAQFTHGHLLEIGEKNGISPKNQKIFEMKYEGIPTMPDGDSLPIMIDTFCEFIFNDTAFNIVEIQKGHSSPPSLLTAPSSDEEFEENLVKMENIKRRYDFENELIEAVTFGHIHKIDYFFSALSEESFEKRHSDPIRNKKNYLIISNTLLRKAAEQGGVHPIYLDSISSSFAIRIEGIASTAEALSLMQEMFRSYCRLVRTHSMKDYSLLVKNVIALIDADLSANLSLSSVAHEMSVSAGYLCSTFKKETGKTLTEFIRDRRIKHASYLLKNTHLQIQTVALHCGIMDVQYFSKIFKKKTGKTPKEYREDVRDI